MSRALPEETWSEVKIKVTSAENSKGSMASGEGGLILMVDGHKECEVPGTKYHSLPSRQKAHLFLGTLQSPPVKEKDLHISANIELRDVMYRKPASNLFVGLANSAQGILSMVLMYPIGWVGDKTNRYSFLRLNVWIGAVAGVTMIAAVYYGNILLLFVGLCIFTWYQQTISSIINAVLADNVVGERRTRAGVNYKTFSALAMSFAPGVQLIVMLFYPDKDSWSDSTFQLLLLPGWLLLPFIGLSISSMVSVGKALSDLPNTDEASLSRRRGGARLSQAWLDEPVFGSWQRRFVVALTVNIFFIATLLANGMTVRYFALYFTEVLKFDPIKLCLLNAVCRLFIAAFAQLGKPLSVLLGRVNLAIILHLGSAIATFGIYGGQIFTPTPLFACACYLLRFACLHARDPVLYSITMDTVPPSQRSRWAALNSLRSLSFSASAVLGGYLADMHGYEFSFSVTVASLLACTVIMIPAWLWFPRKEGAELREAAFLPTPSGQSVSPMSPTEALPVAPSPAGPSRPL